MSILLITHNFGIVAADRVIVLYRVCCGIGVSRCRLVRSSAPLHGLDRLCPKIGDRRERPRLRIK